MQDGEPLYDLRKARPALGALHDARLVDRHQVLVDGRRKLERLPGGNLDHHLRRTEPSERLLPADGLVHDDTQGVDVGLPRDDSSLELHGEELRGHVGDRSHGLRPDAAGLRVGLQHPGEAKIANLALNPFWGRVAFQHHVVRREVAVDDAPVVHVGQALRDLDGELEGLSQPFALHPGNVAERPQRASVAPLLDDPGLHDPGVAHEVALVLDPGAVLVGLHDVRVRDGGGQAGLEARFGLLEALRQGALDDLDCHRSADPQAQVDLSERACSNLVDEPDVLEGRPDGLEQVRGHADLLPRPRRGRVTCVAVAQARRVAQALRVPSHHLAAHHPGVPGAQVLHGAQGAWVRVRRQVGPDRLDGHKVEASGRESRRVDAAFAGPLALRVAGADHRCRGVDGLVRRREAAQHRPRG
mmetsp:Transcript_45629/g.99711  ORF Transcript_45629/g.99711 Transcript_45629/m.99711 type:complete len:414 (+) Transcript_45629:130-1371(+)